MERNPLKIEMIFGDRIHAIRNSGLSADETSARLGNLLADIDTHIANAHIEQDDAALAAWSAARDYVRKEIS